MKGLSSLVRRTFPSSFAYIGEKVGDSFVDKVMYSVKWEAVSSGHVCDSKIILILLNSVQMDELACFAPGMLALGSSGYGPDDSQKFLSLAEEVLYFELVELQTMV